MTRPNRNNIIVRMHKRGRTAQQIADALGCGKSFVVVRLREFGLSRVARTVDRQFDGIWDLPEDKLREAIVKRAAAGARAALECKTNTEHSPLST